MKSARSLCLLACGLALGWVVFASRAAEQVLWQASLDSSAGWTNRTPRSEISPQFKADTRGGRQRSGALRIETSRADEFGTWQTRVTSVQPGTYYRLQGWYRTRSVAYPRRAVGVRLEWLDARGRSTRPPEYALDQAREGEWSRVAYTTIAPANATVLDVQLTFGFSARGTVWFDDFQLAATDAPVQRVIRALTVHHRPTRTRSTAESIGQFCDLVEQRAGEPLDLICLPEGVSVIGTGQSYVEVAQPIPGPDTVRLGRLAQKMKAHVVAGVYERSGRTVYNTAVLLGRDGALLGAYRKTHLPREEWEAGIAPGNTYPVFNTDFGRVGLMICWDLQFPEVARALAVQGAEVLLLPIWGGSEPLARARAIENHVFLISSSYDMRSYILGPTGDILAEATREQPVATAELRLDELIFQPWLGNMRTRTWRERRPDISQP